MKPIWVLVAALASGCDQPDKVRTRSPEPSPIGRFQAVRDTDGGFGIYVLDTQEGKIAHCATTMNNLAWCTPQADVQLGFGPPHP